MYLILVDNYFNFLFFFFKILLWLWILFTHLAKRLTEIQKKEIIEGFKDGVDVDSLSKDFNCTKLTIIRNLKINLGEENYKRFLRANKASIKKRSNSEIQNNKNLYLHENEEVLNEITDKNVDSNEIAVGEDFYPESSFLEISPIDYEIDDSSRKYLSSVPICVRMVSETLSLLV